MVDDAAAILANLRHGPPLAEDQEHVLRNSKGEPMTTLRLQESERGSGKHVVRTRHRANTTEGVSGQFEVVGYPRPGREDKALQTAVTYEEEQVQAKDGVRPPLQHLKSLYKHSKTHEVQDRLCMVLTRQVRGACI